MYKLAIILSIITTIVADINFLAIGDWGGRLNIEDSLNEISVFTNSY